MAASDGMTLQHAINLALYRARHRKVARWGHQIWYVIEVRPLQCTGLTRPYFMLAHWIDQNDRVVGWTSSRHPTWHPNQDWVERPLEWQEENP